MKPIANQLSISVSDLAEQIVELQKISDLFGRNRRSPWEIEP